MRGESWLKHQAIIDTNTLTVDIFTLSPVTI